MLKDTGGQPSAWGITVAGNAVYIADTWNHRILKLVGGRVTGTWGTFGEHKAAPSERLLELYGPRDIAVGPDGNLYITDTGNSRIVVLSPSGQPVTAIGSEGIEPGQFKEPVGIAYDPASDSFFVADLWNYRIQRFDAEFNPLNQWSVPEWDENSVADDKAYIAVGPGSIVAVTDPAGKRVWLFAPDGTSLGTLDVLGDETGLDKPIGIAIDAQGRVYVAATTSGLVTRYLAPEPLAEAAGAAVEPPPDDGAAEDDAAEGDAAAGDAAAGDGAEGDAGGVAGGEEGAGGPSPTAAQEESADGPAAPTATPTAGQP
jgi:DNA-binding beta-propeller fold protein YncE